MNSPLTFRILHLLVGCAALFLTTVVQVVQSEPITNTVDSFTCDSDADCLNDGKCMFFAEAFGGNECQCPSGYGGDDCSARCSRQCQNGGSCRFFNDISHGDQDGDHYCRCLPNFTGANCEIPMVECDGGKNNCLYGGTCAEDGKTCDCPKPRVGDQCQYDSPDDPEIPPFECRKEADCLNGGKCVLVPDTATDDENYCQCQPGFGGEDCASSCSRSCLNGGSCRFHRDVSHGSDQDGDTYCECPPHRYMGVDCEIPFVLCPGRVELKCLWGGLCERTTNGYQCACPASRTGEFCQFASLEEQQEAERTTDAATSGSSASNNFNDNTDEKMAALLLLGAVIGAAVVTGVAMFWCRRKTPNIDTKYEQDITASSATTTNMVAPQAGTASAANSEVC